MRDIETELVMLPTAEERRARMEAALELPIDLHALDPAVVRRILQEAAVEVWCEDREVLRVVV